METEGRASGSGTKRVPRSQSMLQRSPLIVAVVSLGMVVDIIAFFVIRAGEAEAVRAEFELSANDRINALDREINSALEALHSLLLPFEGSRIPSREEFRRFAASEMADSESIQALEWIPRVRHVEREAYAAAAREDGLRDFQITQREAQGAMVKAM